MCQNFITIHLYHAICAHKNTGDKATVETFDSFFLVHFKHHRFQNLGRFHMLLLLVERKTGFDCPEGGRDGHGNESGPVTDHQGLPPIRLAGVKAIPLFTI
jgi:hypothetical protein